MRDHNEVVYADAGYQGVEKRLRAPPTRTCRGCSSGSRRGRSVRSKVEHPFLIMRRDFGFAKNLNHLRVLFASANWLMRSRAVALTGWGPGVSLPENRQQSPKRSHTRAREPGLTAPLGPRPPPNAHISAVPLGLGRGRYEGGLSGLSQGGQSSARTRASKPTRPDRLRLQTEPPEELGRFTRGLSATFICGNSRGEHIVTEDKKPMSAVEIVTDVIGTVILAALFVKVSIIGYYSEDVPTLLVVCLVGLTFLGIGVAMGKLRERSTVSGDN